MEKKTTRRIIGVLVVVALVIILLPLMFNGPENQSPIQTSEAKAPVFPGTEIEASAATENYNSIPPTQSGALINRIVTPSAHQRAPATEAPVTAEMVTNNTSQNLSQSNEPTNFGAGAPQTANMLSSDMNSVMAEPNGATIKPISDLTAANNAGDNVIVIDSDGDGSTTTLTKALAQADLNKSEVESAPMQAEVAPAQARAAVMQAQPASTVADLAQAAPSANSIVAAVTKTETSAKGVVTTTTTATKAIAKAKKSAPAATVKTIAANSENAADKAVVDLKKSAWIVQLGSFKNKTNAERLTNSLRAKGYKAFTLETKSNGQTRVCVGPEFKQLSASTLASKIQQDVNLHGIVMTFQPLAL